MKLKKLKVLTIGTSTIDIIGILPTDKIEKVTFANATSSYLLLEMGKKQEALGIDYYFGGGAINAAISMKLLGGDSSCFVKLGKDRYGEEIISYLKQKKIGTENIVFCDKYNTAVSILISSHDNDPSILTYRGANTTIQSSEVPWEKLTDFDALYLTNLSKASAKIFPEILKFASSHDIKVISNPGIIQLSDPETNFLNLLSHISCLTINRNEAEELLPSLLEAKLLDGKKLKQNRDNHPRLKTGKIEVNIEDFLRAINKLGVELVVVTDGKKGAYAMQHNQFYYQKAIQFNPASTVGAGDAFTSTLSYLWLNKFPIQSALELSTLNSASVISAVDAHSGLLNFEALLKKQNQST